MLKDILLLQVSKGGRVVSCTGSCEKALHQNCNNKGYFWEWFSDKQESLKVKAAFQNGEPHKLTGIFESHWYASKQGQVAVQWQLTRFAQDASFFIVLASHKLDSINLNPKQSLVETAASS